jgi:hypothetical protein
MNYRLNTAMIIGVSALVVIAIALFAYTLVTAPKDEVLVEEVPTEQPSTQDIRTITAKQYVDADSHTIAGLVSVPTPCHSVSVEPFMEGEGVELRFTTILESEEVCAQVVSDTPFRVVFTAPENAPITAVWDGVPATLNLIPAESRESLDEEFYYKG